MITMLNNTTWLKLRRIILLFSTLAIVWAQNDAGINITTEYVTTTGEADDLVHGYFNSNTAIAITAPANREMKNSVDTTFDFFAE